MIIPTALPVHVVTEVYNQARGRLRLLTAGSHRPRPPLRSFHGLVPLVPPFAGRLVLSSR